MAQEGTDFTTPVGRIVYGHPVNQRKKTDQQNKPIVNADGTPAMNRAFGVAIPKAEFEAYVWPYLAAEAAKKFPNVPPQFSWKYKDGDGIDRKGQSYALREGYAGCYVLSISSELDTPPPIYQLVNGAYVQLPGTAIKCGDYVAVGLNVKVNAPTNPTHTPGVYVNPTLVELVGLGTEIISQQGPDPMQALGGVARALPPGATPPPMVAGPGAIPGAMPMGAPQQPGMPGAAPMMAPAPMQAPVQPVQPVMQPQPLPVATPVAPARPIDPTHVHNNGNGTEQWLVNGQWDGQQHPIAAAPVAQQLPPPAPQFVQGAGMPAQPMQMPGAVGGMPGMPAPR